MGGRGSGTTTAQRLTEYLFDGHHTGDLAGEVAGWMAASRRFRSFVEVHRDKIRKKLRGARDVDARLDVRAELAVGRLFSGDRRVAVTFEAYGSARGGPDFTLAIAGERPINLEVTRVRSRPHPAAIRAPWLVKLRQLPPSVPNAILLAVDGEDARALDVATAVRQLRERADRRDDDYFARVGLEGAKGFYERFLRLGAVLVWAEVGRDAGRLTHWTNPSARIPISQRALRVIAECLRAL